MRSNRVTRGCILFTPAFRPVFPAAYDWDPATHSPGLGESSTLAVEAPLWSETIRKLNATHYLLVPRPPALAEVSWSAQAQRSWDGFRTRIATHAPRWRLLGINFYASPQVDW